MKYVFYDINAGIGARKHQIFHFEKPAVTKGVTVWCGMCSDNIVGPVFFDNNVNSESYIQLLQSHVLPFFHLCISFLGVS